MGGLARCAAVGTQVAQPRRVVEHGFAALEPAGDIAGEKPLQDHARVAVVDEPVVAAVPPPAERPAREPVRPAQAESAYGAALATFRAREHGQAVLEFLDFIGRYPKHPLAANAQYWIGEAYYSQRDYRQALVEFQKVLEYPAANGKAADALLKMGLCYTNLREPTRANEVWTRVIGEHPSTEAAGHARSFLRNRRALAPGR